MPIKSVIVRSLYILGRSTWYSLTLKLDYCSEMKSLVRVFVGGTKMEYVHLVEFFIPFLPLLTDFSLNQRRV